MRLRRGGHGRRRGLPGKRVAQQIFRVLETIGSGNYRFWKPERSLAGQPGNWGAGDGGMGAMVGLAGGGLASRPAD